MQVSNTVRAMFETFPNRADELGIRADIHLLLLEVELGRFSHVQRSRRTYLRASGWRISINSPCAALVGVVLMRLVLDDGAH
jgi:hypothetical protein